jgi:hypothetical protein
VGAFIRDKCTCHHNKEIGCDILYQHYRIWCNDSGRIPSTRQIFGRDLRAARPEVKIVRPRTDAGHERPRLYVGITIGKRVRTMWTKRTLVQTVRGPPIVVMTRDLIAPPPPSPAPRYRSRRRWPRSGQLTEAPMANNAAAARARRKCQEGWGLSLSTTHNPGWRSCMNRRLPNWREDKGLTHEQLRQGTEKLIADWCQDFRREKAAVYLSVRRGARRSPEAGRNHSASDLNDVSDPHAQHSAALRR